MWITQTYLKSPEPGARLHLYYLFESYNEGHVAATKRVQADLERFSRGMPEVCILFPNERSEIEIEREQRDQGLLKKFAGALPGVLVLRTPLEKLNLDNDEVFYIQFNHQGLSDSGIGLQSSRFAPQLHTLMQITSEQLQIIDRTPSQYERVPLALRIWRAIEIKPGIFGFAIDAKKLFERSQAES